MTIKEDMVIWDDCVNRLSLLTIPEDKQYKYIERKPCITFGLSYENTNFKGMDIFTLFDILYIDTVNTIENILRSQNGSFRIFDMGADTDGYLDFEMINGRLFVKGQLGASFASHSLKFEFEADQTLVSALLETLVI